MFQKLLSITLISYGKITVNLAHCHSVRQAKEWELLDFVGVGVMRDALPKTPRITHHASLIALPWRKRRAAICSSGRYSSSRITGSS
jgi:hypothetical protein